MIEIMPESHDNILGIRASAKLTDDDYMQVIIPEMETLIEGYVNARFLFYLDDEFEGWDREAFMDDAAFGPKLQQGLEKMAVVGGPKWVQWGMKLDGYLTRADVKTFPGDELQQAWDWISS